MILSGEDLVESHVEIIILHFKCGITKHFAEFKDLLIINVGDLNYGNNWCSLTIY